MELFHTNMSRYFKMSIASSIQRALQRGREVRITRSESLPVSARIKVPAPRSPLTTFPAKDFRAVYSSVSPYPRVRETNQSTRNLLVVLICIRMIERLVEDVTALSLRTGVLAIHLAPIWLYRDMGVQSILRQVPQRTMKGILPLIVK